MGRASPFDARGAGLGDRFAATTSTKTSNQNPARFENAFDVVALDLPYVSRDCLGPSGASLQAQSAAAKLAPTSVESPWLRADWASR